MSKKLTRIDQIKLDMTVAIDEGNKIQQKIQELVTARDSIKMKIFSCQERIAELENFEKEEIKEKVN
tara:strand:- start:1220 stop:1420 length:201 start_codon:yes stop_codon:yes gene_type:complete